ncbi:DUF4268 domain-containing protein [Mycobacterium sp. ITM-2016-00316]|uniref:DUF4268 domain-containing protein n=1 Tax=Mycobacterium sp. ITM-2016-00316 TaxID=2099695 RepID=UPI001E59167D|nr:DUF4268 domain-containing protein [Mycobacterium sp. ITM-2016-00316]WNG84828.1 DUF4268 domain-containing protein [Mycobacterium sp. ITM-2016-00316]
MADGLGWQIESTDRAGTFIRGTVTIEVHYAANDVVERAVKRGADGDVDTTGGGVTARVDQLRSWLACQDGVRELVEATVSGSQLYSEFWRQFRSRVAAEYPDWRARSGTSRTAPNATLPTGVPRTFFCSAFKPGPLRLELAFGHLDPAVNLARFESLRAKKGQFEFELGESVVWDEMPGKNDTRLYVVSAFTSVADRDQWPAMMEWLIQKHLGFRRAIQAVGGLDADR